MVKVVFWVSLHADPWHGFRCAGLYKPGGVQLTDPERIQDCVETTRLRYKEVAALLQQALEDNAS